MSSPDPLNESAVSSVAPSSVRRVTRSQQSQRFISLDSSPRKQTFELQVGDRSSPQRLLVTVETEGNDLPAPSIRRKLFQSPSPMLSARRLGRTTTTTVPLRDLTEDENEDATPTTPRRRGRPRKSNGTPMPSAGKKRKADTPHKGTPRRRRTMNPDTSAEADDLQFENSVAPTPLSKRRGRPPKNRLTEPPSSAQKTTTVKRGGWRRQALAPDELMELADEAILERSTVLHPAQMSENDMDLVRAPSEFSVGRTPAGARQTLASNADPMSDIWMATLSEQDTPRAEQQNSRLASDDSPPRARHENAQSEVEEENASQAGDYGFLAPAASDSSSVGDEPRERGPYTNDTIAQGEDFSMIFMDSIPSLQASFIGGARPSEPHDLGDETNLIINQTLESIRQQAAQDEDEDEDDEDRMEGVEIAEPIQSELPQPEFVERETASNEQVIEPSPLKSQTPWWISSRTPRRPINSSPLRHRVLKNSAKQAKATETTAWDREDDDEQTPKVSSRQEVLGQHDEHNDSNMYEDSFSEIPQGFLAAATPARPDTMARSEVSDEEMAEPGDEELQQEQVQEDEEPEEYHDDARVETMEHAKPYLNQEHELGAEPEHDSIRGFNHQPELDLDQEPEEELEHQEELEHDEELEPEEELELEPEKDLGQGHDDELEHREELQQDIEEERIEQDLDNKLEQERDDELQEDAEKEDSEERLEERLEPVPEQNLEQKIEERREQEHEDQLEQGHEDELEQHGQDEMEEVVEDEQLYQDYELEEPEEDPINLERPLLPVAIDVIADMGAQAELERPPTPDDSFEDAHIHNTQGEDHRESLPLSRSSSRPASIVSSPARRNLATGTLKEASHASVLPQQTHNIAERPTGMSRQSLKATPINQMSSPLQDPQSLAQDSPQEKIHRPVLSSIVRAGRVLQSVTSDPPSPGDRQKQLGSPFRSSGSKESLPPGSKDNHNGRLTSKSPPRPFRFTQSHLTDRSQPRTLQGLAVPGVGDANSGSSREALGQHIESVSNRDRPLSRESAASSLRITPPSDGAMSWVEKEGPISPKLRGDNTLKEIAGVSSLGSAKTSVSLGQINGVADEADEASDVEEDRDDDTDIWEFEAKRQTPRSVRQQPFGNKVSAPSPRRTAIPSTWTRRQLPDTRTTIVGTSNHPPAVVEEAAVVPEPPKRTAEMEEFSLLSYRREKDQSQKDPSTASKPNRFDLSSFFSSPANIPGMLAEKLFPTKPTTGPETMAGQSKRNNSSNTVNTTVMPTNSMFPQVPQRQPNPQGRQRQDFLSPIRAKSPTKEAEVEEPVQHSSSPSTPERLQLPTVAQKQNFTPRPRQTSHAFFQPSSRAASVTATPPRMQLTHADIHRWQQETSDANGEPLNPALSLGRSLLRPLPAKNASPTKSSLRSPLKPRTPGRVVEFTSSVLSPAEQALVRQQRRLSNSMLSQDVHDQSAASASVAPPAPTSAPVIAPVLAPAAEPAPKPAQQRMKRKRTHDVADGTIPDAPPPKVAKKTPQAEPLSLTIWTRQHWLLLDGFLQRRRQAPFKVSYERKADKYLGKTVKSHGEAMTLERWHLDCVDAFRAVVGGWDEGALVKRLFALIVGEEKRRRQKTPSRVMFH